MSFYRPVTEIVHEESEAAYQADLEKRICEEAWEEFLESERRNAENNGGWLME